MRSWVSMRSNRLCALGWAKIAPPCRNKARLRTNQGQGRRDAYLQAFAVRLTANMPSIAAEVLGLRPDDTYRSGYHTA